jgi:CRP/FNR family cyclic AMP-dependent transcriptional regulator
MGLYPKAIISMATHTIGTESQAVSGLLSKLDADRQRWLIARSSFKTRGRGEHIFYPDQPSGQVFFISAGRVKVGSYASDGRETIRYLAYPGDIIGHQALAGETHRKEFATAMDEEVTVQVVDAADLLTIMRSSADFALEMMQLFAERLERSQKRCDSIIFSDARTRIVDMIREMALAHGQVLASGSVLITHPLTHQDIASLTATSRQTVTTVLNELKDREIINFDRRTILVHEMATLR